MKLKKILKMKAELHRFIHPKIITIKTKIKIKPNHLQIKIFNQIPKKDPILKEQTNPQNVLNPTLSQTLNSKNKW
jgi:hypothetical protein